MQKRSCCRHSTDWRKRRPEKVLPEVRTVELSELEDYLMQKLPQHD